MKLAILALALVAALAALPAGAQQSKGEVLVVKVPVNFVDVQFDAQGGRKAFTNSRPLTVITQEGWQLVSVTRDDAGHYTCFFRR